jgi:hypothetical protein
VASAEQKVDLGRVGPEYGKVAEDKYKKVMEEYKEYLSRVSEKTVKEVKEYRLDVEKFNQQKRILYRSLSQEGRRHLLKEREFKKKSPGRKIGN